MWITYNDKHSHFAELLKQGKSVSIHYQVLQVLTRDNFIVSKSLHPKAIPNFNVLARWIYYSLSLYILVQDPSLWKLVQTEIKEKKLLRVLKLAIKNWWLENVLSNLLKKSIGGTGFISNMRNKAFIDLILRAICAFCDQDCVKNTEFKLPLQLSEKENTMWTNLFSLIWYILLMIKGFFKYFSQFILNWDSLRVRLNSHREAWSYKKKKHTKNKTYMKSI